tara:strand:- start:3479 stop:4594 length:1116 start_codon:yes stop_codon:yes gene_type:complete
MKTKILFYNASLKSGGKERRLIELLTFLKNSGKYELHVVMNYEFIEYEAFLELGIPYQVINKKKGSKDLSVFLKFFKVVKNFKPDLIHTWGFMETCYALPTCKTLNIPLVNSQIASAPPNRSLRTFESFIDRINFRFSTITLANSIAGLEAYGLKGNKYSVIYNGVTLNRFDNIRDVKTVKAKYNIKTKFLIVMVGNIAIRKDPIRFIQVANEVLMRRSDVTFLLAGEKVDGDLVAEVEVLAKQNENIIVAGKVEHVEELVNASDIGMLFSNAKKHGEGIPNAAIEYMALKKPVIANHAGGTAELVIDKETGFIVKDESDEEIADYIEALLDDPNKRNVMGNCGFQIIKDKFNINLMGSSFEKVYEKCFKK